MSLFKKKTDGEPESRSDAGAGRNKVSLLILLVILAMFAYLYFFTSLIVPHEAPAPVKPAETAAAPQVKQSLPPRPAENAAAPTPAPVPANGQKPAAATPAPATPPPVPAAPPAAAPAPTAAPKKDAAPPVKKAEAKPAEQKPAPVAPKKEVPKPVKAAEKAVPAKEKQPAPAAAPAAKQAQKPAAAEAKVKAKAAPAPDKASAKAPALAYTIVVGEFSAAEASAVEAKLNKHRIKPVTRSAVQKNRQMTRLYYGAYTDYDSYAMELEKLKQAATGAFAVEKSGTYSLYAGSFGSAAHAATEKKRLAGKGVKVELQQVSLPMGTVKLSAGPFDKAAADKAAASLKGEGLAVKVVPKGK